MNDNGPNILPCGTPILHSRGSDGSSPQDVLNEREDIYDLNQARSSSPTPRKDNFRYSVS